MVFTKYNFPLPNDNDRYNLSQEELIKILDHVYNCGFQHGKEIATPCEITVAASYENQDDNTQWKEVRIK